MGSKKPNMRIEGWERRLADYLEDDRPFSWGEHDCALWCARWVMLCTGADYASPWIGRYSNEAEAEALLKERGYSVYSDIADAHLEVKPVMLAQRGDIVLRANGSLGICDGRMSHFIAPEGMIAEPTSTCIRAWKV